MRLSFHPFIDEVSAAPFSAITFRNLLCVLPSISSDVAHHVGLSRDPACTHGSPHLAWSYEVETLRQVSSLAGIFSGREMHRKLHRFLHGHAHRKLHR